MASSAFDYSRLADTADRLLSRFGREVTFTEQAQGSDAVSGKPWRGASITATSYTVPATVLEYEDKRIDGEAIKVGDRMVLVSALAVAAAGWTRGPKVGDTMTDGTVWRVEKVSPLSPGTMQLMYEIQVRGGGA